MRIYKFVRIHKSCYGFYCKVWCFNIFHSLQDKPGKPAALEITKTDKTSVSLQWQPPKDDGGAEITNYVVEYRLEDALKWTQAKDKTNSISFTVNGLKEGRVYEFRVSAENQAGVGPASDPTKPTKAAEVIGEFFTFRMYSRS